METSDPQFDEDGIMNLGGVLISTDRFSWIAEQCGFEVAKTSNDNVSIVDPNLRRLIVMVANVSTYYTMVNHHITERFEKGEKAVTCYGSNTHVFPNQEEHDGIILVDEVDGFGHYENNETGEVYPYVTPVDWDPK